jgi:hypothetical protein
VPDHPDASKRYLFYLHGRIIELQGRKAVSPDYGPYEYDGILRALAEAGFEVISEVRPSDTGLEYGKKIAAQARSLLAAKVPPEHITIAGFSKGGAWPWRRPPISVSPRSTSSSWPAAGTISRQARPDG